MLEEQLRALGKRELVELLWRVLQSRDEVTAHRREGLRLAQFVYDSGEVVYQELVGVADWRGVQPEDEVQFEGHFTEQLVQSGTCDVCRTEILSYSKGAQCPVCGAHVQCT